MASTWVVLNDSPSALACLICQLVVDVEPIENTYVHAWR